MSHFAYQILGFGSGGSAALASLVIAIVDTAANIALRTGDDAGTIAYGTDTNDLYVYDGSTGWHIYSNNA